MARAPMAKAVELPFLSTAKRCTGVPRKRNGNFYWRLLYTCVCAGLVVIDSLRTALGSLKEDEQFVWATISVDHFRNVCQPR